jgi:hypothetical protein
MGSSLHVGANKGSIFRVVWVACRWEESAGYTIPGLIRFTTLRADTNIGLARYEPKIIILHTPRLHKRDGYRMRLRCRGGVLAWPIPRPDYARGRKHYVNTVGGGVPRQSTSRVENCIL